MFKKVSFLLTFMCVLSSAQNTFIPDPNFEQALIDLGLDNLIDGAVLTSNISSVKKIEVNGKNISDLTGIEGFTDLEELYCYDNLLSSLNVTNNLVLRVLWCFNNKLSNLDVTRNLNLKALVCAENNLTSIDTRNNSNLIAFSCETNQITSLDLSNNVELNRLLCSNNLLTSLNLNNNIKLNYFDCSDNLLNSLNLINNKALGTLICFNNNLLELDLSNNHNLISLKCSNNDLCSLNIRNSNNHNLSTADFTSNPDLNCVIVDSLSSINSNWIPVNFSNYVDSPDACSAMIPIDEVNDFIGASLTLPSLINGTYYTESNAEGIQLLPGEIITTSQTIYIFNNTQCYTNETSFSVLITNADYYIPKYFTPNNDNSHDTWKVIDNKGVFTSINIYNRHGKLLKSLPLNNFEWDGTFRGELMHTDDYWFIIYRDDALPLKGHFTLKR